MTFVVCFLFLYYGIMFRNIREDTAAVQYCYVQPMKLHDEVLQYNPEAFQYNTPGKRSI